LASIEVCPFVGRPQRLLEARGMIVIGVDVHKQSVTAVAVDEAGRMLDERTVPVGSDELIGWASALDAERLWAIEDCRLLTPWLERLLLGLGEEMVRVSPKQGARQVGPDRRARCRQGSAAGAGSAKAAAR
jgi:transposase